MGSALPADTEAPDTPDSVYREQFTRSSSFGCDWVWGIRIGGLEMPISGQSRSPGLRRMETFSSGIGHELRSNNANFQIADPFARKC
jgi:hypothetical protein